MEFPTKKTYPPTKHNIRDMCRYLRLHNIRYRFYTSLPRDVYEGYIWSLYWYNREGFSDVAFFSLFMTQPLRDIPILEVAYRRYAEAHGLIGSQLSVEDFTVHLHLRGDTFSKTPKQVKRDLKKVSAEDYAAVLDSIFYKDVFITYLPTIRKRLLIYLKKGAIYTVGRVSHTLKRRVLDKGVSTKYFTLRENQIISNRDKQIGIVCNRLNFYKEFYE